MDKNTIFTLGCNIEKSYIFNCTALCIFITIKSCDNNRFGGTPPIRAKAPCFNNNIGIAYIFNRATVTNLN